MSAKLEVVLEKDVAFALLGCLSRFVYDGAKLEAKNEMEIKAVRDLCQIIDNELLETFREDYKNFVKKTRGV